MQAVGNIATYSDYPTTTNFITLTSASYSTATSNATQPFLLPKPTLETDLPLASGTASNCYQYRNYESYDFNGAQANGSVTQTVNTCGFVASDYGVTIDQLVQWNPSLDVSDCAFQPGYRYCTVQRQSDASDCKPSPGRNVDRELG
jgi:hypothetical protein